MTDAAPAQEPTTLVTPFPTTKAIPANPKPHQATVETAEEEPPMSSAGSKIRHKLQPKSQHERCTTSPQERNYATEITYEEDDGSLPEGYLGTWKRARFYSPDYGVHLPCSDGRPHLSCNHWVTTDENTPCGLNCHDPYFEIEPFTCPKCYDAMQDVIENQLSAKEKAKVEQAINAGQETFLVGYLVEFVKHRVIMTGNVTETVISIVRMGKHKRHCRVTDPPENASSAPLEQQVREYYAWKAAREFAAQNPTNTTKRKLPAEHDDPIIKRPKHRVFVDEEPPAQNLCGAQRPSTSTHLSSPTKKTQTAPPVQYGDVRFAAPLARAVGPLVRKRDGEVGGEVDGRKRARWELVRDGDEEVPVFGEGSEEEL
ncbi:hypothetical protein K458DRAFT_418568 [Lentithecium fluviatile CBS 122367]|uniref:Uncharacterized protein n=1 Tax=Lentithecium fluviatile CBS 122367 TaxID=1168545 RepID=A0A6G1IZA6_9PLEO|nr:hypothetical protein K458DRAFT_418568 [Lentithecium fluviatile CBS 122367]